MTKYELKEKAICLRKQGLSLVAIEKQLGRSRATIRYWCKDVILTKQQIQKLLLDEKKNFRKAQLVAAENKRQERKIRRNKQIEVGKKLVGDLSKRELMLIGTALYWGEGGKTRRQIVFGNGDSKMIKLFVRWLTDCFEIVLESIRVRLLIFANMDERKEKEYWQKEIGIKEHQFYKTYVKENKKPKGNLNKLKHGVVSIYVHDTNMFYKIEGMIEQLKMAR